MTTLQLLELTDDTSYLILLHRQPHLIEAIEAALRDGATAAMIEVYAFNRLGRESLLAGVIAGAAHHIEKYHIEGQDQWTAINI